MRLWVGGVEARVSDVNRQLRDQYWHLLCHRSELPNPGDFLRLPWLGEDVVVYNDQGELFVFDNVCPHRGARFVLDQTGNAPLVCRYHGWSYRGGRLRVAQRESFAECELEGVRLGKLECAWCGDFLFAAARPKQSLTDQLEGVIEALAGIGAAVAARVDLNCYVYECDWKVAIENALEPAHIAQVHTSTLATLRLSEGKNEFFSCASVWYAEVEDTRSNARLKAMSRFFAGPPHYQGYMSIFLYPFSMVSSTYGYSYSVQNFFPGDESFRTNFTSRLLSGALRPDVPPASLQSFFESTSAFNRKVFDEDHEICKRVSRGYWNAGRAMPLSRAEEKVAHFRRLYRGDLAHVAETTSGEVR